MPDDDCPLDDNAGAYCQRCFLRNDDGTEACPHCGYIYEEEEEETHGE